MQRSLSSSLRALRLWDLCVESRGRRHKQTDGVFAVLGHQCESHSVEQRDIRQALRRQMIPSDRSPAVAAAS
jgi:hypothetical protein